MIVHTFNNLVQYIRFIWQMTLFFLYKTNNNEEDNFIIYNNNA